MGKIVFAAVVTRKFLIIFFLLPKVNLTALKTENKQGKKNERTNKRKIAHFYEEAATEQKQYFYDFWFHQLFRRQLPVFFF